MRYFRDNLPSLYHQQYVSFQFYWPFKVNFLLVLRFELFLNFRIAVLCRMCFHCNYLLSFCVLILLKLSFTEKFLNLIKSNPIVSFTDYTFYMFEKVIGISRPSRFSPMLYSRILTVLCFIYGVGDIFELILSKVLKFCS